MGDYHGAYQRQYSVVDFQHPPKKIKAISFGLLSDEVVRRMSHLQVGSHELYQLPSHKPVPYGVLDTRLGTSTKSHYCETCGQHLKDCVGHFGYLKLELPSFHIGFMKNVIEVLQSICKTCSRILLSDEEKLKHLNALRKPNLETLIRKARAKQILDSCKKIVICPHCHSVNGTVKQIRSTMKIIHEKYKATKAKDIVDEVIEQFKQTFDDVLHYNKDIEPYIGKAQEDISPIRALQLFSKISDSDAELLNMNPNISRPEHLILTHLIIPPVCIRPSVPTDIGSNEDDLTVYLSKIILHNNTLKSGISMGKPMEMLMETWHSMQLHIAFYINSELPGFSNSSLSTGKPCRSLTQRLKGKHGRFRGNLSGKRVDFSSRTVISPDPNLEIRQVGVPLLVAKVLTFPEVVNEINIEKMRRAVINGPDIHPGANFVQSGGNGDKKYLKFANREMVARNLRVGDIVERHLNDGDQVLFNRQPSLHRLSIMCHEAKVLPFRTFRFNECCCAPYNADFDGDEMNLHLPQTQEAKAEANGLMGILHNLITPRNGEPLVSSTQDFLTGTFLLTRRNMFLDRSEFCMLCSYMGISDPKIDLPPPTILKPIELWTGKQLYTLLIKPNHESPVLINFEARGRNYTSDDHFCSNESYICFKNSEIISGTLDKKIMGDGSKNSLYFQLIKHYGAPYAAECMGRVARVTARWLMNYGFSIGINDVQPSDHLTSKKTKLVNQGYSVCDSYIQQFNSGKLEPQPGCNAEQTLEAILNKELSEIRNTAGKMCMEELHWLNAPLIMSQCGSKGSVINISQMVACVGQQTVSGSRISNGFVNRTLPHFYPFARTPTAKGFVQNSFYTGLTPTEFFFHTMAGREGLVDTAVKTAETGYMQRRLMKALEDLTVHYDQTVRNSVSIVVQFNYGDDNLDPYGMEASDGRPINFHFEWMHIRNTNPYTLEINNPDSKSTSTDHDSINPDISNDFDADNQLLSAKEIRTMTKQFLKPYLTKREYAKIFYGQEDDMDLKEKKEDMFIDEDEREKIEDLKDMTDERKKVLFSAKFCEELKNFVEEKWMELENTSHEVNEKVDKIKRKIDMMKSEGNTEAVEKLTSSIESWKKTIDRVERVSRKQLRKYFEFCAKKYERLMTEPGQAVGAIAAQSIGEPGTQMTLKTFHFAGVASMNVTLGVPRILEIMNATRNISTPIITAALVSEKDEKAARIVKGRIEKTTLEQVAKSIREVYDMSLCYVEIKLNMKMIRALQLDISNESVVQSIINTPKIKVKEKFVKIDRNRIQVFPTDNQKEKMYFSIQHLRRVLPRVIVSGIPSISRAVISRKENDKSKFNLLVEGTNLQAVMGTSGINGKQTTSNNVLEIADTLGIEAARKTIMNEIYYTMSSYGMTIDFRHMMLLADVMSFKGEILGITRYGIAKMKDSVLMLASFEKTSEHLFDAAVHTRQDTIEGISECIIMGTPINLGTGLFKLLQKVNVKPKPPRVPLFLPRNQSFTH